MDILDETYEKYLSGFDLFGIVRIEYLLQHY